jgi:hypothetical protein
MIPRRVSRRGVLWYTACDSLEWLTEILPHIDEYYS